LPHYDELDEGQRAAVRRAVLGNGGEAPGGSAISTVARDDMILVDLVTDMRTIVQRLNGELKVRYPSLIVPDRVEVACPDAGDPCCD
jgi:hypothetical protein